MNCIEFRRILLTDPGTLDAEFTEHRHHCPDCSDAVERSAHFERCLQEAVNIPVPENLASRILLKQSFESHDERPWWRTGRVYALAASIMLVAGLVFLGFNSQVEQRRLSEEFVALVNGAPYALAPNPRVSSSEISTALEPAGLDLQGDIGDVTFAGRCIVRGKLSGHIVVRGDTAPVTVFLISEQLVTARATIRSDHYSGVVVPQGTGTIAIVSSPGESLENVEALVRSAIRWAPMQDV
ncbi:MAG: DUF3379 family protein [Gammaproteobacteria bacterium]|jgi:hypothetical protein|nr:DUF3379 family protein [Gammaproteobacteria bacterium]